MLFLIMFNAETYPMNIIFVGFFLIHGMVSGTNNAYIGENFKFRKYLKSKQVVSKSLQKLKNPTSKSFWCKRRKTYGLLL